MKDIHFWEDALDNAFKKLHKLDKKINKLARLDKKVADKIKVIDKSKVKRDNKNVKFFTHLRDGFSKKRSSIKNNNIPYILNMIKKFNKDL
jgi:hypothetical protein